MLFRKQKYTALALLSLTAGFAHAAEVNTATFATYTDIKDWDPAVAFSTEVIMLSNVYEPLLWFNPPGSNETFSPALAKSWSVSEDGLTWEFKLREGVTFHDGSTFDSSAAKASIERTVELKKGAYYIWPKMEISTPDASTLVIKTEKPSPIDLIASSQYGAYIYSTQAADKGTDWFNQGNAAGTGPYKVASWEKGQQVLLEQNEQYWGGWKDNQLERVVLKYVSNPATQVQMIKAGDADFISLPSADLIESLSNHPNVEVLDTPSWKNSQFLINTQKYPTDNKDFRKGLQYAWDYQSVVDYVYAGGATIPTGIVPHSMWGAAEEGHNPTFDLAKAKKYLNKSGVPKKDWVIDAAYINSSEAYKNALLMYQENLRQVGVTLNLKPGPWGKIWNDAKNVKTAPNLQSMTWWPTYATPSDWLIGLFKTEETTSFNLSHYSNAKYDDLVDKGVESEPTDKVQASQYYQQAQQVLIDDAVAIFYADLKGRIIHHKDIEGITPNPAYAATFFYQLTK